MDAARLSRAEQIAQQDRPQALVLPAVLNDERDLRRVRAGRHVIARHGHQLEASRRLDLGHERQPLDVVHVGEHLRPVGRQPLHHGEETLIRRMLAEACMKGDQPLGVRGTDRPDEDGRTVRGRHGVREIFGIAGGLTHGVPAPTHFTSIRCPQRSEIRGRS